MIDVILTSFPGVLSSREHLAWSGHVSIERVGEDPGNEINVI